MSNNYDPIAGIYDRISRLIFRKSIVKAQQALLRHISPPCEMLIVGGGSGWILEEIAKIYTSGINVTYVDSSAEMIRLAKTRDFAENKISFVQCAIENYTSDKYFEVIMTAFLFDNFNDKKAAEIFRKLSQMLSKNGLWLFADFHVETNANQIWQRFLLKTMYLFFRITCGIEAYKLPDMESMFAGSGYKVIGSSYHFRRFIKSIIYQRN